jgi:hypothetical protein
MIFPFDVIDWLFNIKLNPGQGSDGQQGSSIGSFFSSVGGHIAAGLESGFVATIKDLWEPIRPIVYIAIGAIIMALASLWFWTGSASFQNIAGAGLAAATVVK